MAFNKKGSSKSALKSISHKSFLTSFTDHSALKNIKGPSICSIFIEFVDISFLDSIKYSYLKN